MCVIEMTSEDCETVTAPHYFEIDPPCPREAAGSQVRCPNLEVIVTHGAHGRKYTYHAEKFPVCCACTSLPIEELRAILRHGKLPLGHNWGRDLYD